MSYYNDETLMFKGDIGEAVIYVTNLAIPYTEDDGFTYWYCGDVCLGYVGETARINKASGSYFIPIEGQNNGAYEFSALIEGEIAMTSASMVLIQLFDGFILSIVILSPTGVGDASTESLLDEVLSTLTLVDAPIIYKMP